MSATAIEDIKNDASNKYTLLIFFLIIL